MALLNRFVLKPSNISRCLAGVRPELGQAYCAIAAVPARTETRENWPSFRFRHVRSLHSEASHGKTVEVDLKRLDGEDTGGRGLRYLYE